MRTEMACATTSQTTIKTVYAIVQTRETADAMGKARETAVGKTLWMRTETGYAIMRARAKAGKDKGKARARAMAKDNNPATAAGVDEP